MRGDAKKPPESLPGANMNKKEYGPTYSCCCWRLISPQEVASAPTAGFGAAPWCAS